MMEDTQSGSPTDLKLPKWVGEPDQRLSSQQLLYHPKYKSFDDNGEDGEDGEDGDDGDGDDDNEKMWR